jgi:hypothetical protein
MERRRVSGQGSRGMEDLDVRSTAAGGRSGKVEGLWTLGTTLETPGNAFSGLSGPVILFQSQELNKWVSFCGSAVRKGLPC